MSSARTSSLRPSGRWRLVVSSALFLVFLVVDQVTKALVRAEVAQGPFHASFIPGVLDLEFVANRGAAFGMGEGMGWVFVLLAVAVLAFVALYLSRAPLISPFEVVGLGMLAGGAVGNAIDRVLFGYVCDFFATTFIDFPVFNVADIGITLGVAVAAIGFIFPSHANAHDDTPGGAACQ